MRGRGSVGGLEELTDDSMELCALVVKGLLGETGVTSFASAEGSETVVARGSAVGRCSRQSSIGSVGSVSVGTLNQETSLRRTSQQSSAPYPHPARGSPAEERSRRWLYLGRYVWAPFCGTTGISRNGMLSKLLEVEWPGPARGRGEEACGFVRGR